MGNIAPFLYTVSRTLWPHRLYELPVIYSIIGIGAVSCLLLAFFWDVTSVIDGTRHSTALLCKWTHFFAFTLICLLQIKRGRGWFQVTKKSVIKYLENYHKAYKSVCLRLPYRRYGKTENKILEGVILSGSGYSR